MNNQDSSVGENRKQISTKNHFQGDIHRGDQDQCMV
jgi:hypothetical protein